MLKAEIILPAASSSSFPVMMEKRKDGRQIFRIDYRLLNQKKLIIGLIQKLKKFLKAFVSYRVFPTVDRFSDY